MKLIKCDRCTETFSPSDSWHRITLYYQEENIPDYSYDLCALCTTSLKLWAKVEKEN